MRALLVVLFLAVALVHSAYGRFRCSNTSFTPLSKLALFKTNVTFMGEAPPWQRGWKQTWGDEFNGNSLDRSKWDYNYPWGIAHNHNGVLDPSMVSVSNGQLHLRAINQKHKNAPNPATVDGRWLTYPYTTGGIHSANHFRVDNGYIEISARFPNTIGFWPSAWSLGNGWPPEIDIVEHLTNIPNKATYNYHYTGPSGQTSTGGQVWGDFETNFHIYGVEWNSGTSSPYVRFFLDQNMIGCCTFTSSYVNQAKSMYWLLDLGVGGWASDPNGSTDWNKAVFDVDWIRFWLP